MSPPNTNSKDHHENQNQNQLNQISSSETKKQTKTSPDEQKVVIKCPRCDSPNTKFCYYNNYSLSQPRHFCKTCRRYWTNGGSLRNVPIGGGCRKKQKHKNSVSSLLSSKFPSPSLDFHLGSLPLPLPPLPFSSKPSFFNQFSTNASSSFQLDHSVSSNSLMGLNLLNNFSNGFISGGNENEIQGMNFMNVSSTSSNGTTTLASSIESLSCMNQDLHLKLQQQRFSTMFGGGYDNNKKDDSSNVLVSHSQVSIEKTQPMLFQNLEISKTEMFQGVGVGGDLRKEGLSGDVPKEWFSGMNSYSSVTSPATRITGNACINGDHDNGNNNWNNGVVHGWGDV